MGLLDSKAFNGNLEYYPFTFSLFLELNRDKDWLGYTHLFEDSGSIMNDQPTMVKPDDWEKDKNCPLFISNNVPKKYSETPF